LDFDICFERWETVAIIPKQYLPPSVTKFNAYAIHGEGWAEVVKLVVLFAKQSFIKFAFRIRLRRFMRHCILLILG